MRTTPNNPNPNAYYERNSFSGPAEDSGYAEPPLGTSGAAARYDHREDSDDYVQPGNLLRLMDAEQQARLFQNIAEAIQAVPVEIVQRQLVHFCKADPGYGEGVAKALGVEVKAAEALPAPAARVP